MVPTLRRATVNNNSNYIPNPNPLHTSLGLACNSSEQNRGNYAQNAWPLCPRGARYVSLAEVGEILQTGGLNKSTYYLVRFEGIFRATTLITRENCSLLSTSSRAPPPPPPPTPSLATPSPDKSSRRRPSSCCTLASPGMSLFSGSRVMLRP